MEIHRLTSDEGPRLRRVRLRALRDAPDAFGTTFEEAEAWAAETWTSQLENLATFVASRAGADVRLGFLPTRVVSTLPPPREHILEHQRALDLSKRGPR